MTTPSLLSQVYAYVDRHGEAPSIEWIEQATAFHIAGGMHRLKVAVQDAAAERATLRKPAQERRG